MTFATRQKRQGGIRNKVVEPHPNRVLFSKWMGIYLRWSNTPSGLPSEIRQCKPGDALDR